MPPPLLDLVRGTCWALRDLLYPPACRICGGSPGPHLDFCSPCLQDIAGMDSPACPRCARRAGPNLPLIRRCSGCRGEGLGVDRIVAAATYEGAVRDLIHRFKFRGERSLGPPLGRWIARAVLQQGIQADRVVPVPLHWWRALKRGYNQSEVLAETVSREIGVPLCRGLLRRPRATKPQSRLRGARSRALNVRGAFDAARGARAYPRVLLIDDVLSTGATLAQCGGVLKKAGVRTVTGAVVAR